MAAHPRRFSLESLEARQMMAGDVAAYVDDGVLYITEAEHSRGASQHVQIESLPNGFATVSVDGGVVVLSNGVSSSALLGDVHSINVELGNGNDSVEVTGNFDNIDIDVSGGGGRRVVDNDSVELENVDVLAGNVTVTTGPGIDRVTVENDFFNPYQGTPRHIGSLDIDTGAGADTVDLTNAWVIGDASIYTYENGIDADVDKVNVNGGVHGNLFVRTGGGGDHVTATGVMVTNLLHANTGGGVDHISVTSSDLWDVEVYSGGGGDYITLRGNSDEMNHVRLISGQGGDQIVFDDNGPVREQLYIDAGRGGDQVFVRNNEQIDFLYAVLGAGDDTMVLENNTVLPFINGGDGFDVLYKKNNLGTKAMPTVEFEEVFTTY